MNFWKITGLITGFLVVTFISRKCKREPDLQNDPNKRYNIDDLLMDQEI